MTSLDKIKNELQKSADPAKAEHHYRFFKAFPGGYGEGDQFLGITVPVQRQAARKYYREVSLSEVEKLLQDLYHEYRLTALLIMRLKFDKAGAPITAEQSEIVRLYLNNIPYINNWDLVDSSAPYILGPYLYHKDISPLEKLSTSGNLWAERTAVLATFYFIRKNSYSETLRLSRLFLHHPHDLMHKAVGWMLREIGNRDFAIEFEFLKEHYHNMPRTMLRYAIEKFDPELRQQFLKGRL